LTTEGIDVNATNTKREIVINGIKTMTNNNGAITALTSSHPAADITSAIHAVRNEVVIKTLMISNVGSQIKKNKIPHAILTNKKGRKLNQSIFGCIKPIIDKPRALNTKNLY
jgi:tryptophan synthase beta subunit